MMTKVAYTNPIEGDMRSNLAKEYMMDSMPINSWWEGGYLGERKMVNKHVIVMHNDPDWGEYNKYYTYDHEEDRGCLFFREVNSDSIYREAFIINKDYYDYVKDVSKRFFEIQDDLFEKMKDQKSRGKSDERKTKILKLIADRDELNQKIMILLERGENE